MVQLEAVFHLADFAYGLDAVLAGHLDVHQHGVVFIDLVGLDGLVAVFGEIDIDTRRGEHQIDHATVGGIVFDTEQLHGVFPFVTFGHNNRWDFTNSEQSGLGRTVLCIRRAADTLPRFNHLHVSA